MKALTCLAAAALAWPSAWSAPRATIALRSQVEVAGDAVVLGDVARLSSPELALMQQLVHLPIGRIPGDGRPAVVDRARLARWIQRETGIAAGDLDWQGSDSVRVVQRSRLLAGSDVAAAAAEALRESLRQRRIDGEVRVARWPRDLQVPAGQVQLRARPSEQAAVRGRMLVWVDVWAEARFVRTVPVALEVQATGAYTPLADLPASHTPTPASRPPASASPLLVERGGWATLRSSDGAVSLESKVAVLQDGRAGDQVRVRGPGGGAIVFARVVGPAQLELAP
jgi:flagella basal body P-ring formation protein FlgA